MGRVCQGELPAGAEVCLQPLQRQRNPAARWGWCRGEQLPARQRRRPAARAHRSRSPLAARVRLRLPLALQPASLACLPAPRLLRGAFGERSLPSHAEVTAGRRKQQRKAHGARGGFWKAAQPGNPPHRWVCRVGASTGCFSFATGTSSLHLTLATACSDGQAAPWQVSLPTRQGPKSHLSPNEPFFSPWFGASPSPWLWLLASLPSAEGP